MRRSRTVPRFWLGMQPSAATLQKWFPPAAILDAGETSVREDRRLRYDKRRKGRILEDMAKFDGAIRLIFSPSTSTHVEIAQ